MHRKSVLVQSAVVLAAITVAGSGLLAQASNAQNSEPTVPSITLRVYDYAHMDPKTIAAAKTEAGRILAVAGVKAQWVDCPTTHADWDKYPDCQSPIQPNDFLLHLLPVATTGMQSVDALGNASNCQTGLCAAKVFLDRVSKLAAGDTAPHEILLGRVMAHEIGHLLLGQGHSRTGIMKAAWSGRELGMQACSEMVFTPEQSSLMKASVTARAQAQLSVARFGNEALPVPANQDNSNSPR